MNTPKPHSRLEHFPVTFFGMVMGLIGLTLALHAAETSYGLTHVISHGVYAVVCAIFAAIALTYVTKGLRYPHAVRAEWHHPIRLAFFPAITISFLLLSVATLDLAPGIARLLWWPAMLGQAVLTIAVITGWISARSFQTGQLSPAWFIPAVGNVIVPIAGVPLGHPEISWYFFSVGVTFWLVLLTLVMNRLIFHDPLPGKLQPTLVILIAPPAVGFVSWLRLNGGDVDAMARFLLNAGYFFTLLAMVQFPRILRLPFAISFWALSFPMTAITIASFRFAALTGSGAHLVIGSVLMLAVVLIIAMLLWRTARAMRAGEICVPE